MLTKKPQRLGWETIDMICHNQAAYQILAGEPVCWDIITAKDGSVARPITLTLQVPAGIVRTKLGTSGNYDDTQLVRAYGYATAWQVGSTATPGAMLKITSAGSELQLAITHANSAIAAPDDAFVIAIAATTDGGIASSTYGQSYEVFVRALK